MGGAAVDQVQPLDPARGARGEGLPEEGARCEWRGDVGTGHGRVGEGTREGGRKGRAASATPRRPAALHHRHPPSANPHPQPTNPPTSLPPSAIEKVNEFDQKKAAAALGVDSRPLSRATIEKFLGDFGLDPEFAVHSNIRGLSGGQKVKLVLAAAMWNSPHVLVMDE